MTNDEVPSHTRLVAELARSVSQNPRLSGELQRARRQFFGEDEAQLVDQAAEHRFAEWFLFERESESLGAVPTDVPPYAEMMEQLDESFAGVFLVEGVSPEVTARDIQNGELLELDDAKALQTGDLLVGRLYQTDKERWTTSAATPALRPGRALAEAFLADLQKVELGRRLQQIELEHLLLKPHGGVIVSDAPDVQGPAPSPLVPLEHLEADLDQLLRSVGDRHDAEAISQQLAAAPRPGALIGPLLDQLAFDTDVDLDKARRLMLEIWNAHHAGAAAEPDGPAAPPPGPPGESLGEQLVRKLDEGLGNKQDVEELFRQMEQMASIEAEEDEDDEDDEDEQDRARSAALVEQLSSEDGDSGDLAPLVTEFQWETQAADPEDSPLWLWVELQRNAPVPNTDVESIASKDVLRLLLHVYLRSAPAERARHVRSAFDEVTRFYDWLSVTQEIDVRSTLAECEGTLLSDLDRLQAAGVALSTPEAPSQAPGLLQIEEFGQDGFGARDDDGGSYWVLADETARGALEVGDLLLAGLSEPTTDAPTSMHRKPAGMVVVLPSDARALIE